MQRASVYSTVYAKFWTLQNELQWNFWFHSLPLSYFFLPSFDLLLIHSNNSNQSTLFLSHSLRSRQRRAHTYYLVKPIYTWASENSIIVIRDVFFLDLSNERWQTKFPNLPWLAKAYFKIASKDRQWLFRFGGSRVLKLYMQPCMSRKLSALVSLQLSTSIRYTPMLPCFPSISLYIHIIRVKNCVYVCMYV